MDKKIQFQNLVECSSLDMKIKMHLDKIYDEEKRITFITSQKQKKLEEFDLVNNELNSLSLQNNQIEKELYKLYKNTERSTEHLAMAQNQKQADSTQHELELLRNKIDTLESEALEILEKIETVEIKKNELHNFLENIDQTIKEVTHEVSTLKNKESSSIEQYESRIKKLLDEIDPSFKEAYQISLKQFRFKTPLTFIMGKKCRECHFEVDEYTRDSVDRNFQIEHCSGCNRLIVPISATNA